MMYIILLIYFVNIVTGDDSSEAKYIDLLPEKEKEDFLQFVGRRIFENFKDKNTTPEKYEHTKLIEKILKEESLNLNTSSQNNYTDKNLNDGKVNVVEDDVDALGLKREGKRNKRNSLKENKNSDVIRLQQADFNELSKELEVSDTEDIEVKHTNNKQTEANEGITTESNVEEIKITAGDLTSKEDSTVQDHINNYEQEEKTTKSPSSTPKPEEIRDINEDAYESIGTPKKTGQSHIPTVTEKINVISRRNVITENINDSSELKMELEPVAITEKTSLSTSPDMNLTEPTSKEAVDKNEPKDIATNAEKKTTKSEEKKIAIPNAITRIETSSPEIETAINTTELSKILYDKLNSNFDTDNITLGNIRDDGDSDGTKALIDDKNSTIMSVITVNSLKLDKSYFDEESTAAAVDKIQNPTTLKDFAIPIQKNFKTSAQNINSLNHVTESDYKDIESSESIVNVTDNNNKAITKVIKNSQDYAKKKHSTNETAVNEYSGTTFENNINSMKKNSKFIDKLDPEIIRSTTRGLLIYSNKEIVIENKTENSQNKSDRITDGIHADIIMKSIEMTEGPELLINERKEIEIQNNRAAGQDININKTDANYEEVTIETMNIGIKHDNSAEKNKINNSVVGLENNIIENNEGTASKTVIETTTVKIEILTVAIDTNKSEGNDTYFSLKEDTKPYVNQDNKSKTPNTNHESVFEPDENKMVNNLKTMENISANFVNDMIKVIKASFSYKSNEDGTLSSFNDNPKPKEYKLYKTPKTEPLDRDYEINDDKVIEENPYYVPVYNYGPNHAYYNPQNRLGPNADDDDATIIKNDGLNEESIAHDYDSFIKDNNYIENDDIENYQNRQDTNLDDARNDVYYDEAYNKEREFIDRMGDINGNYKFTRYENLIDRNTAIIHKSNNIDYMKNFVKIYKNSNNKNRNKQSSRGRYKLNLPIVKNNPKYSDIIMNSHDYLDVDYRYPKRYNPKQSRHKKHGFLRTNENSFPKDLIITSLVDDPYIKQDDSGAFANPYSEGKFNDDSTMLPQETQNQETENAYKIMYDDDYENYDKKPLENSINLFESEESVWESKDTKQKRNKQKNEDEKSLGVKNQIRKIREMMHNAANFGFIESKEVEEIKYHGLKDFIKKVPKMCDGEDPSCEEPYIFISNNHIHNRKQSDSGRHALNKNIASNHFMARANNSSDFVDYVPNLSTTTKLNKFLNLVKNIDLIEIIWLSDISQQQNEEDKADCSFCDNVCYVCVCGTNTKYCKVPEDTFKDNELEIVAEDKESNETPKEEDIPNTVGFQSDMVNNVSMLPSYLDPILKKQKQRQKKTLENKVKFRSRNDKLRPKNTLRNDGSLEDNNKELKVNMLNIIKFNSADELTADNPDPQEAIETSDTKPDDKTKIKLKIKNNKTNTLKSIMESIPDDVELLLKVTAMLENVNNVEIEDAIGQQESPYLRSTESIDLESYVAVLQDMVRNEAKGLAQYDWMGTSIDIQAAVFKLKEMIENVKNNEVLEDIDYKLLKYFTFLHKLSMKRQQDLRMVLPKPKYKYNTTTSQKGVYSRIWLMRRLKKFTFEVSGTDLYYFMDFLEELQFYLYDLHTAIKHIATVTSYKNQHWFKNLTELYLDYSKKNMLELLLHVTSVRLLDLIENSVQTGLQDGFLQYVTNNEKIVERSKNEFLLILRIIEELKKMS